MNSPQQQTANTHPGRTLWIVEVEQRQAHIYQRTDSGTKWIGDARMDEGQLCLDIPDLELRACVPCAPLARTPQHYSQPFLTCFGRWLTQAEREKVFDKAVLVACKGTISDLRLVLSRNLDRSVKLAADETLAKNASEDRLAECMWH